jgi:hypothetical protein
MLRLLLLVKAGIEASASSGCSEPSLLRCRVCVVTARKLLVEDGGLEEFSLGWEGLTLLKGFSFFRENVMLV